MRNRWVMVCGVQLVFSVSSCIYIQLCESSVTDSWEESRQKGGGGLYPPSLCSDWPLLHRENAHWESEGKREREREMGARRREGRRVQSLSGEERRRELTWRRDQKNDKKRRRRRRAGVKVNGWKSTSEEEEEEELGIIFFPFSVFLSQSATGETRLIFSSPFYLLIPLSFLSVFSLWRKLTSLFGALSLSLSGCVGVLARPCLPVSSFVFLVDFLDASSPSHGFICSPGILRCCCVQRPVWKLKSPKSGADRSWFGRFFWLNI